MTYDPPPYTSYSNVRKTTPDQRKRNTAVWKKNNPGSYAFYRTRARAKLKNIPFSLTKEWVDERIERGVCEVTDLPFTTELGTPNKHNPWSPSIDRKDASGPYSPENCRLVVWIFNCACSSWGDEPVRHMARSLV